MKKILAILLAAVMVAAMFAGCGGKTNYTANNTEYVIGLSGPLTGAASIYGVAVKNAAEMVHLSNNLAHCQPTESEGVNWEECP